MIESILLDFEIPMGVYLKPSHPIYAPHAAALKSSRARVSFPFIRKGKGSELKNFRGFYQKLERIETSLGPLTRQQKAPFESSVISIYSRLSPRGADRSWSLHPSSHDLLEE